jgi:hypothetical protein
MNIDPTFHLYLDDLRTPKNQERPWVIVRDYDAFVAAIEERGFPIHMSLDHDLGEDIPTGMDCTKWFIEKALDHNLDPMEITWNVHSANVAGKANMEGLLKSWTRFFER